MIDQALVDLRTYLNPEALETGLVRGQTRPLEAVIADILAQMPESN